ncbi:MAG: 4Fe-4S binding protein [Methanobacteriaceae archaeon]
MSIELAITREICHGCGNCVVSCPVNALNSPEVAGGKGATDDVDLIMVVEDGAISLKKTELCGKCGTCVEACPVDAIRLEDGGV